MQDLNQPSSTFDELAKTLNREERQQMLNQVHKDFLNDNQASISPKDILNPHAGGSSKRNSEGISFTPLEQEMLRNELKKMSWILRFLLIIKGIFTQKSLAQLYSEHKLKLLRQVIISRGNFINFDTKSIGSRFVSEIVRIHTLVSPIKTLHLDVWHNSEILNALITNLLIRSKSVAVIKTKPTDFVDFNQLLHLFTKSSDEDSVKQAVAKAQRDYFNTIPSSVFKDISDKLLPFYALYFLMTYPFRDLLILLGATDNDSVDSNFHGVKPVPVAPVLGSLEEFFSILLSVAYMNYDRATTEVFLREALRKQFRENDTDGLDKLVYQNIVALDEMLNHVRNFLTRVPLSEIFCYFHNNPFYKVQPNVVRLSVKNFYIKSSSVLISGMMTNTLQEIRMAYVNKSIEQLFHDRELVPLKYYVPVNDRIWDSLHLKSFIYAKAMMLASNFLNFDYTEKIGVFKNVLGTNVFSKIPGLQAKFHEFCSNIDLLKNQVHDFDESLSKDSEQGKSFIHIQTNLADNFQQARLVQAFVDHKDFEAHALLMNLVETLDNFVRFTKQKILENTSEAVQTQLAGVYQQIDRNRSLRIVLEEWGHHIHTFSFMLRELVEHERTARGPYIESSA